MERIEIPKDCLLCDVCNKQVSDQKFVALEDISWYEGWLYCQDCEKKYHSDGTDEGVTLRLHHAEQVDVNGDIIISNDLGGVEDQTTFILSNATGFQNFETKFSYFGARFVKISGWPENKKDPGLDIMTCYFVHTSLSGKSSIKFYSPETSSTANILSSIPLDISIGNAINSGRISDIIKNKTLDDQLLDLTYSFVIQIIKEAASTKNLLDNQLPVI